jgi:hypothetical protein
MPRQPELAASSPEFGDHSCWRAIALRQSDRQGVEAEPLPPDLVEVRNLLGDQYATLDEHFMNWPVEVRWAGSVGHVRRGSVQHKHAHLEIDEFVGQIKRQVGVLAVLRGVGVLTVPTRVETQHGVRSERPHVRDDLRSRNLLAGLPLDRDNDPLADESVKRYLGDGFAAWDEMRWGIDMGSRVGQKRRMRNAHAVSLDGAQLPDLGGGVSGAMEHAIVYRPAQVDELASPDRGAVAVHLHPP